MRRVFLGFSLLGLLFLLTPGSASATTNQTGCSGGFDNPFAPDGFEAIFGSSCLPDYFSINPSPTPTPCQVCKNKQAARYNDCVKNGCRPLRGEALEACKGECARVADRQYVDCATWANCLS